MARRYKRLRVTMDAVLEVLKQPTVKFAVVTPLPEDAKLAQVTFDPDRCEFNLFIQSDEFDEVPDYAIVPVLDMQFSKIENVGFYIEDSSIHSRGMIPAGIYEPD